MIGVPRELNQPLKAVLKRCEVFRSNDHLREFFIDERLQNWQDELRDTSLNREERAGHVVDLLIKHHSQQHNENALVLFLCALAEEYYSDDERHDLLMTFANELRDHIKRPPVSSNASPHTNSRSSSMLFIEDTEKMLECARSVAQVKVQRYHNRKKIDQSGGTGWLIAPSLLVTCWHVVAGKTSFQEAPVKNADLQRQIAEMRCIFGYIRVGSGVEYEVDKLLYPQNEKDARLDYALLRLKDRTDYPLKDYDYLRLDSNVSLTVGSMLYIIQHPQGRPQMAAGDTFERLSDQPGRICYRTQTAPGTSGAPLLNFDNWRVVGLHNGGYEHRELREGTSLEHVLSDLRSKKPELYMEIMAAHPSVELDGATREDAPPTLVTASFASEGQLSSETSSSLAEESSPMEYKSTIAASPTDKAGRAVITAGKQRLLRHLKKYQDDFSNELAGLQAAQKPFAPPGWRLRSRRNAHPDEGEKVLKALEALDTSMKECEIFLARQTILPGTLCLDVIQMIHHFQSQLSYLRHILAGFCAGDQPASSELQKNIYRQIGECRKFGDKIRNNLNVFSF